MEIETYVLPGDAVFPEGIALDSDGRTFYVSGARSGAIYRGWIDEPALEEWQPAGQEGRTQATGMAVDGSGRLLVCGWRTGALYAFDTDTGALAANRSVPAEDPGLNDVCVHNGYAYVTDSAEPLIWRFALGETIGEAERWLDLGDFGASRTPYTDFLNGIVPTPIGTALVVAAQASGVLWHVDIPNETAKPLAIAEKINGDGLAYAGHTLYVCDNTDEPDGSTRYWLSAIDPASETLLGRWERPHDDSPTTLALVGHRLLLVNSQFAADRQGRAKAPFTISAIPLPR